MSTTFQQPVAKVVRDDMVAVIYSPGYGAGWSTWVHDNTTQSLYDPDIVAWIEAGKTKELFKESEWSEKYGYLGGLDDAMVEWIRQGVQFTINEYDGYETIKYNDYEVWNLA